MLPPTRGNAINGQAAAALGLAEIAKLVAGAPAALGTEMLLDLEHHQLECSRLVRNPDCRFFHERWQLEPIDDVELDAIVNTAQSALGVGNAERGAMQLALPGRVFAVRAECAGCSWQEPWALTFAHDPRLPACPRCDAPRRATGFAQRETVRVDALPTEWLGSTPGALGLWAGDVLELRSAGALVRFELAPGGKRVAPVQVGNAGTQYPGVVLHGLGNIGSQLAPQLARIPGIVRVSLVDFDEYDPGQQRYQAITASDANRPKVEVAAETIRRIAPELEVREYPMPLEAVPLGVLRNSVVVGALDSIGARVRLAQRAWHAGAPFVDTGVGGGDSLVARATLFGANDDGPCFCCLLGSFEDASAIYPCDAAAAR